jgi:mRNA deadenylase 3'-5' endonuclease subunit Ccr4
MDVYTQTATEIDFSRGEEITPTIVDESGHAIESKTFSNKTHQWEELLDYITYWENSYCEVYL